MKGLEAAVELAVVCPEWRPTKPGVDEHKGWCFPGHGDPQDNSGATADPVFGAATMREVYERAHADGVTKFTVPVLFDRVSGSIVNNESSEILRMLNAELNAVARNPSLDLYPLALRAPIDAVNDRVYAEVNNGVYQAGFARSQDAYEVAAKRLFAALEWCEELLSRRRFLCGAVLTEADVRLAMTLFRYDIVYFVYFKCSYKLIREYPNLHGYMCDVYQADGMAATVNIDHCKRHYFKSHTILNAFAVVPLGLPEHEGWATAAHGRGARAFAEGS